MSNESWLQNVRASKEAATRNEGPTFVGIVSGSESEADFWQSHLNQLRSDLFRADRMVRISSIAETTRKGNFLGLLAAWHQLGAAPRPTGVGLLSMVVGRGQRLSPFTQALNNRKSTLPLPYKIGTHSGFLCSADVAALYTNSWTQHLRNRGFEGLIVKWGDEAIIPGTVWTDNEPHLADADAVRFVWRTPPTETLAREKEWVLFDREQVMLAQFARSDLQQLSMQFASVGASSSSVGVNLGSVGISYRFLDAAVDAFHDLLDTERSWIDWDPYVWMALYCSSEREWRDRLREEERVGRFAGRDLLGRVPNFFERIQNMRQSLEGGLGRRLRVSVLDFGDALWLDFGLHATLRGTLEDLVAESARGRATRSALNIPEDTDDCGNRIVNSTVAPGASICNSVVIDSHIAGSESHVRGGVIVGSTISDLQMPEGGSAILCDSTKLVFGGPRAVALLVSVPYATLQEGDRLTSFTEDGGSFLARSNESLTDYAAHFDQPVFGNRLSFGALERLVAARGAQSR